MFISYFFFLVNWYVKDSRLIVCVEVLRPSQPNEVMSSAVSLPNHVYWAGLVLYAVNQYCAHSFARNWQLPFLNHRKGENDRRKYFTINLHERMLPTSAGLNPRPPGLQSDGASNWATEASWFPVKPNCFVYEISCTRVEISVHVTGLLASYEEIHRQVL